jgi:hypothetical protein
VRARSVIDAKLIVPRECFGACAACGSPQTQSAANGGKGKLRITNHGDTKTGVTVADHRWCCQLRGWWPTIRPYVYVA